MGTKTLIVIILFWTAVLTLLTSLYYITNNNIMLVLCGIIGFNVNNITELLIDLLE